MTQKKPIMREFFYPLLNELKSINIAGGLSVERGKRRYKFMPLITHFCGDLPAKIDVQEMISYVGYNACGYCSHPGISVKANTKSSVRYIRRKNGDPLRTHEKILEIYHTLKHKSGPIEGIKNISCMVAADEFDLIWSYCIDYMHCILLGVMKKLLSLWLDSTNHTHAFYIKPADQLILSRKITSIKPISEISRKPGPVSNRLNYKANDYRTLLLYYLRFSLVGVLSKRYIDNFQLLSSSIYTLLKETITMVEIHVAERNLNEFCDQFESLYGSNNVTMNIHLTRHIAESVRQLGPLWAQSAFALEANNGILGNTTARRSILQSIAWKYNVRCSLSTGDDGNASSSISVKGKKTIHLSKDEEMALSCCGIENESSNSMTIFDRIT